MNRAARREANPVAEHLLRVIFRMIHLGMPIEFYARAVEEQLREDIAKGLVSVPSRSRRTA
jgi:hypothetical protein